MAPHTSKSLFWVSINSYCFPFPFRTVPCWEQTALFPLCFSPALRVPAPCPDWHGWNEFPPGDSVPTRLCYPQSCPAPCPVPDEESSLLPMEVGAGWQTRSRVGFHSLLSAAQLCLVDLIENHHPQQNMSKGHVRLEQSPLSHKPVRNWSFPYSASGLLQQQPRDAGECLPSYTNRDPSLWLSKYQEQSFSRHLQLQAIMHTVLCLYINSTFFIAASCDLWSLHFQLI